ncbi:MAG: hypothetical protein Q6373_011200 [Candidatus Sigynarchaeota archaeon]
MEKRESRFKVSRNAVARAIGSILLMTFVASFIGSTAMLFNDPRLYFYTPPYQAYTPRDAKMGTYVYDHEGIASHPKYFDDIALMVDRVLVDLYWTVLVKNASYPNCFDLAKFAFYDHFF